MYAGAVQECREYDSTTGHSAIAATRWVIDNDDAVCGSLKFSLKLEGFRVWTFSGGRELLCAQDIATCHCFVIDQKMPGMSGIELIGKLRERNIGVPAILIISQPSVTVSDRAQSAHVSIVEKPLLGNALPDRIREACLLRSAENTFHAIG